MKKIVVNAKNFGTSVDVNQAILEGCVEGFLSHTELVANGYAYENAINDILPDCTDLSLGIGLNITNGYSLSKCSYLTNSNGKFNKNFFWLLKNQDDNKLLSDIELEFRTQIERVLSLNKIQNLSSVLFIHCIPKIFNLVCALANEYKINYVTLPYENFYITNGILKHVDFRYFSNFIRKFVINHFSEVNNSILENYNLKSNDYILGIGYKGLLDLDGIQNGLACISDNTLTEFVLYPSKHNGSKCDAFLSDFKIIKDYKFRDNILKMDFEITNYKN